MVATAWPDLIRAIAIFMATVDFPDPPFSLPTTITRADSARIAPSIDMRLPLTVRPISCFLMVLLGLIRRILATVELLIFEA